MIAFVLFSDGRDKFYILVYVVNELFCVDR